MLEIHDEIERLGSAPDQGTAWPQVMPGLRWLRTRRATLYFKVDDRAQRVDVLAILFGSQDHHQTVLDKLFGPF
ncbi:MAG: type II toxin-antitoxin system RelE/ParE family toxin [Pseudomonadota bacterium]